MDAVRGHLAEQNRRESLLDQAGKVSISVKASGFSTDPLELRFTLKDPGVKLLRIDLINRLDTPTGSADCIQVEPLIFSTTIDPQIAGAWFQAGDFHGSVDNRLLRVRAILEIEGAQTHRALSVIMSQDSRPRSSPNQWEPYSSVSGI